MEDQPQNSTQFVPPPSPPLTPGSPGSFQPQEQPRKVSLLIPAVVSLVGIIVIGAIIFIITSRPEKNSTDKPPDTHADQEHKEKDEQLTLRRRQDTARILASIESYAADHHGTYPSNVGINDQIRDRLEPLKEPASKKSYTMVVSSPTEPNHIQYATFSTCTDNLDNLGVASSKRAIALLIKDDSTKTGYFCVSNS